MENVTPIRVTGTFNGEMDAAEPCLQIARDFDPVLCSGECCLGSRTV